MNSLRATDRLEKAWLKVNAGKSEGGSVTVQGELFDGTPFSVTLAEHEIERQDDDSLAFVPVSYNGAGSGFCEIVLPKPVLNFGHTVRVSPNSIVKWQEYRQIQEIRQKEQSYKK